MFLNFYPALEIIALIILGSLPSFAWLFFFLKEDDNPEPKKMVVKVFVAGFLIAIPIVLLQFQLKQFLEAVHFSESRFIFIAAMAAVEEIFKFLAAYLTVRKNRFFDEPVDAMIYMITAALGLAMFENVIVVFGAQTTPGAIGLIIVRFIGATLLHALSSGIIGYYWAKSLVKTNKKTVLLLEGFVLATLLHGLFNYFIIISGVLSNVIIYNIMFLTVIALFVFRDFEKIKNNNE